MGAIVKTVFYLILLAIGVIILWPLLCIVGSLIIGVLESAFCFVALMEWGTILGIVGIILFVIAIISILS